MTLLLTLAHLTTAHAAGWTDPRWYARPVLNAGVVNVNGVTYAQASAGAQGGFTARYKRRGKKYLNHTRARGVGIYGLSSGSYGADLRVGSFYGPIFKRVRFQHGPDLWYSGFGTPSSPDYTLAWSPGLDLYNGMRVKIDRGLFARFELVPGWAFVAERQTRPILGIFHEMGAAATLTKRLGRAAFTVGYGHRWNAAGQQGGLIIGAGVGF